MNIWFTADTHFGSDRALNLSRRPFRNVKEMDTVIINAWNSVVAPDDVIYHLGDFGDYNMLQYLNGEKHLILGNYERKDIQEHKISMQTLCELGFVEVAAYKYLPNLISNVKNAADVKLVHEPLNCDRDGRIFNLFGHIHGRQMCKHLGLDVGVDAHYFRPINVEDVCFYANAIRNGFYDENVWFDI